MNGKSGPKIEAVQAKLATEFNSEQVALLTELFETQAETGKPPDYRRHLRHVLATTQPEFSRPFLNLFCDLTSRMRDWGQIKPGRDAMRSWLRGRRAMLYFTQPSSRTVQSFEVACKMLGIEPTIVQDKQVTSAVKDEKELETIRTFSSYYDIIIMRSPISGLAARAAEYLDTHSNRSLPVINAGGGTMHHPTQGLLDIYTLDRTFRKHGRIDNKVLVYCGDLLRSRTVHSDIHLLRNYSGVELRLVSPPEMRLPVEMLEYMETHNIKFVVTTDMAEACRGADAIYMVRAQNDDDKDSIEADYNPFYFKAQYMMGKHKLAVLHPGPRGPELTDEFDNDPRILYWRQIRNGMWARVTLLFLILYRKNHEFIWD